MHRRDVVLGALAALLVKDVSAQGVRRVRPGDTVSTGADSETVLVFGRDAMLVRANASLTILEDGFRLVTGAVLGVFAPGQRRELRTSTATIGIRGTAVYLEAERTRTYVCTCYGETVLEPADDPGAREAVSPKRRHEQPRYILARGAPRMMAPAPVLNHTDAEIELLQKLLR